MDYFSRGLLSVGMHTHTNTHRFLLSCIMHQMSSFDCTVVVALTTISDYPAFSTSYKHTAGGIITQNIFRLLRQFVPFFGPGKLFPPE